MTSFAPTGARWKWRLAAGLLASSLGVGLQAWADDSGTPKWTPNATGPRDFEGVWAPAQGGPPGGGAPKGAPSAAAPAPAPAPAASNNPNAPPPEIGNLAGNGGGAPPPGAGGGGGAPPGGPPAASGPSTLQCAPTMRLGGAGGGMSNLWIQSPKEIVMVSEEDQDIARKIYMNAKHPVHLVPQPNGNSVGHWEGNTLVVDSIGYEKPDGSLSDEHVVEHITKQGNKLVDDLDVTQNGQTRHQQNVSNWRPDLHVFENVCEEGFDRYQVINGQVTNPNIPPSEAQ